MASEPAGSSWVRRHGVTIILLIVLTIYGVEAHGRREVMATPASLGDQGAYLAYAKRMSETNYSVIGDRNRMPVYPFLLSLLYRTGMSEEQFLRRAQIFNVNLSIVLLGLLFAIFRRFFSGWQALALLVATAFGVVIYRAINAQTEVLFYFVSFCSFLVLLQMLIAPRWWLAIPAGATVGVAHLTKASIPPALGIWVVLFVGQSLQQHIAERGKRLANLGNRVGILLCVLAGFAAVTFPYLRQSKAIYGSYFFNVNSSFVMWCDSASGAMEFLERYSGDERRSLSPDQIPSPSKYWREHSVAQMTSRLMTGLWDLVRLKAQAIGYYKFVALLLFVSVALCFRYRQQAGELLARNLFPVAFCVLFLLVYLCLYAWYGAIVKDSRFVLSIFLPFIFAASVLVSAMGKERVVIMGNRRFSVVAMVSGSVVALALVDVVYNGVRIFV